MAALSEQEEFELLSLERERAARTSSAPKASSIGHGEGKTRPAAAVGEALLSMGTGAVATALGGLAGVAGTVLPGEEGQGARYVKKVQDALTYQPRTEGGQEILAAAAPIGEALESAGRAAGTATADATGSPLAGAAVDTAVQTLLPPGIGAAAGGAKSALKGTARSFMHSAVKPMWKDLKTGDAAKAIDTLLDEGVSPTMGGMAKLRERIDALNDEIKTRIGASNATVDVQQVGRALQDTFDKFSMQVNPNADLATIRSAWQEFQAHPALGGSGQVPVSLAQKMKQGTYRVLAGKYGEVGSAATESQKALARGLKEEIAANVPEVAGLNAKESLLLNALKVGERRALFEANKNPMGLSLLAQNPAAWAAFMADRSAAFKALAARLANRTSEALPTTQTGAAVGAGVVAATE